MNCPIFQPSKGENRQEHLVINDLLISSQIVKI